MVCTLNGTSPNVAIAAGVANALAPRFTGWKEPLQAGGRRFAIGCFVSHLDHAFGGPG